MNHPISLHSLLRIACLFLFSTINAQLSNAQVSGTVFRDFNANGIFETTGTTYNETGLAGVQVKVYDQTGTQLGNTTVTDANGLYFITGVSGNVRAEFILPSGYFASKGLVSNTTIQFVNAPNISTNLGVNAPEDYWDNSTQPIPSFVIPCYANGTSDGPFATDPAVVVIDDAQNGITGISKYAAATQQQVGTVWGMARDKKNDAFFTTAFLKRHSGVGPAGFGGVYLINKTAGAYGVGGSFNLQGIIPSNSTTAIDLGSVTRNSTPGTDNYLTNDAAHLQSIDLDANGKVGKISFGGAEFDESTQTLFIVNTYQKTLIAIGVAGTATSLLGMTPYQLGTITRVFDISNLTSCTGGSLRPWGLHFRNGVGYIGTVCDAAVSQSQADVSANIFSFNAANPSTFTNVLSINMQYRQGEPWHPWTTDWSQTGQPTPDFNGIVYSEPLLGNIEFDEHNNMIISVMNRAGHQLGYGNLYPLSGSTNTIIAITHGDLLKACYNPATGTWAMEETAGAACGPNYSGTWDTDNYGYGNATGTLGEFFNDRGGDGSAETAMGSATKIMGTNRLVVPVIDPWPATGDNTGQTYWSTGGLHWYNVNDGSWNQHARIYDGLWQQTFGKAEGLGDLEPNLPAAPIEIGNRVWADTNQNGVQDADEIGIDGVTLQLYEIGVSLPVGTVTTANGGQYYFTSANTTGGVMANTNYEIRILSAQSSLTGLVPTTANAGGSNTIDNDGTIFGNYTIKSLFTGNNGNNNHSYDFGFSLPPCTSPNCLPVRLVRN
jgi:hypothetical protein